MRLSEFIRENNDPIIREWESFAKTLVSTSPNATPLALRDHIKEILSFIASDIESAQTQSEQVKKSHGEKPEGPKPTAAEIHASLRHAGGFNLDQMVSEYRSLRASVIKLWDLALKDISRVDHDDQTRFNEAVDQAMTESIRDYSEKMDHSRNLFLGILSHDLRTPLGAISMSAQLTPKIGKLNERQTMLQSQIGDSAARAAEIVTHLLDITKTRLGSGLPISKASMDMGFVSKQLVDEMRAMHPGRKFDLQVSGNLVGNWDKARIGQLFSNLLGNAAQYGFKGTPICVNVTGAPKDVTLSVHNEGIPIAPDATVKIFESMTRAEPTEAGEINSERVNLGLGLYISKEIVIGHGGKISVTSSEKDGTTFMAKLPR